MENVGAVAYSDSCLKPREEMSTFEVMKQAFIALHQLCHMWFGNLVTMKWWNDLWLKESFSDYMAASCLMESEDLKHYKDAE